MHKKTPRAAPPGSEASSSPSSTRRRIVTGGLAAGATSLLLPAQWTSPVVESVLLPAHAQTSQTSPDDPDSPGCTAEARCYAFPLFNTEGELDASFSWPEGVELLEVVEVAIFDNVECSGEPFSGGGVEIVLAEDAEAAAEALGAIDVAELETDPEPGSGCRFFAAD